VTLTAHFVSGGTWRAVRSLRTLVNFALTLGFAVAAFYLVARAQWAVNENRTED